MHPNNINYEKYKLILTMTIKITNEVKPTKGI